MRVRRQLRTRKTNAALCMTAGRQRAFAILLAGVALLYFATKADAATNDQIGPDPLRSERCVVITYGYSVMCTDDPLGYESNTEPAFILSCGPALSLYLLHRPVHEKSVERVITLEAEHGEFNEQRDTFDSR